MLVTSQDLRVEKTFKTMIKDKKKKLLYQKILIKMQYNFKAQELHIFVRCYLTKYVDFTYPL